MKTILLAAVVACSLFIAEGHIRLTFPPPRLPLYDFLDNVRMQGPCGIPIMDSTPVTTLLAGSQFQLSFHLAYAHRGGLSIRILHSNGTVARILLPEDGNSTYLVGEEDGTAQRVNITLPSGFECQQCTLQLLRNAREWSTTTGEPYLFWSCAEVQITSNPTSPCPGDCGSGTCDSATETCQCPRGYYGPYCHLRSEHYCSDCSDSGVYVDILSTNVPTKQCFCYPGYHGPRCQFTSELGTTHIDQLNEDDYTIKRELHSALTMYARIVDVTFSPDSSTGLTPSPSSPSTPTLSQSTPTPGSPTLQLMIVVIAVVATTVLLLVVVVLVIVMVIVVCRRKIKEPVNENADTDRGVSVQMTDNSTTYYEPMSLDVDPSHLDHQSHPLHTPHINTSAIGDHISMQECPAYQPIVDTPTSGDYTYI